MKKPLLRVVVEIGDTKFDEDLQVQAMVDPNIEELNLALSRNPGLFAKWAMLEAKARAQYDDLSANLQVLEAQLFDKYSRELIRMDNEKVKLPTLDAIRSKVTQDSERLALARDTREAKAAMEMLTVGRRTIEQKRDSLLALASNWRAEMERGLAVAKRDLLQRFRPGPQATSPGGQTRR